MKNLIYKSLLIACAVIITITYCSRDKIKNNSPDKERTDNGNSINESFRDTGWISDTRYRAVIYIITYEECKTSSKEEIKERIKFEAIKQLQKALNVTFSRNQLSRVNCLLDNYGILIPDDIKCSENNIFYFDIEKNDLSIEFDNIKNLK